MGVPGCTCLKIQNSVSDVLQHWRARHKSSKYGSRTPKDDSMRDAVVLFHERVKKSAERTQVIEVLWKEIEDENTVSWVRGKVTSVNPSGTRLKYEDQDICVVHDFHNDVDENSRLWSEAQDLYPNLRDRNPVENRLKTRGKSGTDYRHCQYLLTTTNNKYMEAP